VKNLRNQLTTKTTEALQYDNTIRNLNDKIRKLTHDKEVEIRGLKVKHEAEIGDAQAKSLRISQLESQTHNLEQQLVDLRIAKATVDREYQNLEPNIHYKEAYEQIVWERDELRSTCNDMKAERDDLKEELQNMAISAKTAEEPLQVETKPDIAPQVPFPSISHPPVTQWDHLDGLELHWENQLKRRMDALEKTKEELALVESEISNVQQRLRPIRGQDTQRRTANPRPARAIGPQAERSQFQLLDVGVDPLVGYDATARYKGARFYRR
jgi:chromosome segregation ATPase